MRFEIIQRFAATPDELCAALVDPDYLGALTSLPDIGGPVIKHQQREGTVVRQQLVYHFTGKLPGAVTRVVDQSKLTWTEDATVDLAERRATFTIKALHYARLFSCRGEWSVSADTNTASGASTGNPADPARATHSAHGDSREFSRRRITGELKVSSPVPFVGGQVERAIVSGLDERLRLEPAIYLRWRDRT